MRSVHLKQSFGRILGIDKGGQEDWVKIKDFYFFSEERPLSLIILSEK